jgi:FkbM family methyltransferase
MIVEIGTSDFRTRAGLEDGLFIEPVKCYYDLLPACRKENIAISNYRGTLWVYYMQPEDIELLGLPKWARGCNSVNKPHPTITGLLINKLGQAGLQYIKKSEVKVERIKTVLQKHKIKKITTLKIDTEGHDCIILNDFLDTVNIKPENIVFEANHLTRPGDIAKVKNRLMRSGYKVRQYKSDYIAVLK